MLCFVCWLLQVYRNVLFVVYCVAFVVPFARFVHCCALSQGRSVLGVVCCFLFVDWCVGVCCLLFDGCNGFSVVRVLLFVVYCLVFALSCLLVVVRCRFVVLLFDVW